MKNLAFFLFFLVCTMQIKSFAQNYTISGQITDGTGKGLSGVTVSIESATAITDNDGNYVILNVPPGKHKVSAYIPDYFIDNTIIDVGGDLTGQNLSADERNLSRFM